MDKIAIIGAGRVGEASAWLLAQRNLARRIMLADRDQGLAQGVALDIGHSAPLLGFTTAVEAVPVAEAIAGADLVMVTAGAPRRPGMSRSDLLEANVAVVGPLVREVARSAPDAILLTVTNPADVMTYYAWRESGFPRRRVVGLSGVLDSARMAQFVRLQTGAGPHDVEAWVVGGHGDAMVPLISRARVAGRPLREVLDGEALHHVVRRTRGAGTEILQAKRRSTACLAPAAAIAAMVEAMQDGRGRVLPCIAVLDGEYGLRDMAMCVPCRLGPGGLDEVIELDDLDAGERVQLLHSARCVAADVARLPLAGEAVAGAGQ